MSEGEVGILVLCCISLACAVGAHSAVRHVLLACLLSALVADVVFQIAAYLHAGYLDPFFIIALFFAYLIAFGIALVVGVPFYLARKKRRPA